MLDKLTQLHKSKFVKCFLIAIVLVFSYEVSKPKAFAPLAFAGAVLVGMAAETLVTMGVKAVSKRALERQAKQYADEALANGAKFDFLGTNPYRNKDGSVTLSPTANDRAKMAGIIAGSLAGALGGGAVGGDELACEPPIPSGGSVVPLNTKSNSSGVTFFQKYLQMYVTTDSDTGKRIIYAKSKITGAVLDQSTIPEGYNVERVDMLDTKRWSVRALTPDYPDGVSWWGRSVTDSQVGTVALKSAETKAGTLDANMSLCNELIIPSTIQKVYPAPMDMSSTYKMPNHNELTDRPMIINNVFPPSETEGSVTWEETNQSYENIGNTNSTQSYIDNSLNVGTLNENPYTIGEINNYYTDVNYRTKVEDFKPPLEDLEEEEEVPSNPPAVGGDVGELDHSMWSVMKNTYNYLDDGIDSSLAAMKGITDSASGITKYLGQTMGWLPAEWRAVFTSAFVLGVFAHFLRR